MVMAHLPLDYLVNRGVVVDIAKHMHDRAVITPQIIENAGVDIRDGDILILHTGWHCHYEGRPQQDLVKYFCCHPGPNLDTLHWMLQKKIRWWGMDTGSCDYEHVDPPDATGPRRRVHEEAWQDAG
jgi:kynurenine formamidase